MTSEHAFYFESRGKRIFAVLHAADPAALGRPGVVLSAPFAEEKLWSLRMFVNLTRALAKAGHPVLRFDHAGHGDSEGEHVEVTPASWTGDLLQAVDVLREKTGGRTVGFLGLRLGATLAAHAAAAARVSFLVLWEPILEGAAYFHDCLRSNAVTQMMLYGKVIRTREQLLAQLLEGQPITIDGYQISREFYLQLKALHLSAPPPGLGLPVFVAGISRQGKRDASHERLGASYSEANPISAYRAFAGDPFWQESRTYLHKAEELFEATTAWLRKVGSPGSAG